MASGKAPGPIPGDCRRHVFDPYDAIIPHHVREYAPRRECLSDEGAMGRLVLIEHSVLAAVRHRPGTVNEIADSEILNGISSDPSVQLIAVAAAIERLVAKGECQLIGDRVYPN